MEPVVYRKRQSAISRGEGEWRVEDDALVRVGANGQERRYKWRQIVGVRLCHEPSRSKPFRYVFELQPKHERKIEIDNAHYLSPGNFEDASAEYTPFVRAAVAKLAQVNPRARALIGETPKRYFFLLIGALLGLSLLAFGLIAFPTPLDGLPYASLIKFGIIMLMLPIFWLWVIRAVPKGVALDSIPPRALPPDRRQREPPL